MRYSIVEHSLDENQARPDEAYDGLRTMAGESARQLLDNARHFLETNCPACESSTRTEAFERTGYQYWECSDCGTLFVSPRPSDEQMRWYLLHSPVAEYRRATFRPARGEYAHELALSRADWVVQLSNQARPPKSRPIAIVNEREPLLRELISRRVSASVHAAMPLGESSNRTASDRVVSHVSDLVGSDARMVVAFDVLERLAEPSLFMSAVYGALESQGLLVMTTRAGSGFDIQALWGELDTIFPLEHINLFSVRGMREFLRRHKFDLIEVSTPGQLDVQVVARAIAEKPHLPEGRLLRSLVHNIDESGRNQLQTWLQRNLLSSHMRVVARKTEQS